MKVTNCYSQKKSVMIATTNQVETSTKKKKKKTAASEEPPSKKKKTADDHKESHAATAAAAATETTPSTAPSAPKKKSKKTIPTQIPVIPASEILTTPVIPTLHKKKTTLASSDINSSVEGMMQQEHVILHLKCFLCDLAEQDKEFSKLIPSQHPYTYNPTMPTEILAYNEANDGNNSFYSFLEKSDQEEGCPDRGEISGGSVGHDGAEVREDGILVKQPISMSPVATRSKGKKIPLTAEDATVVTSGGGSIDTSKIHSKLRQLKLGLFKNAFVEKPSACFWCTCDFATPSIYIPKYEIDGTIQAYGSFCMPECAAAFLMREQIDDSVKFERYQLLNQIYGPLLDYKNSISPAPTPYYVLDKYFGNMSPEEFRAISKMGKKIFVLDRPMTRVLPEMHEDFDDRTTTHTATPSITTHANISIGTGGGFSGLGNYRVKRQDDVSTKICKNTIMKEHFGFV